MAHLTIQARPRTVVGKKVKTLRRQGILPANVYGHDLASQSLEMNAHAFTLLERRLPANAIIDLEVEGWPVRQVMLQRTQRDVRTGLPIHLELFQINALERMTASVPLVLVGESELVRRGEAVLLQEVHAIEVSALPRDLPSAIEVPIGGLVTLNDTIHIRDLVYDHTKLEIKAHAEDLVASLTAPQWQGQPAETAETTEAPAVQQPS